MKEVMLLFFALATAAAVMAADYVPGEILVYFNDNVDEAQAGMMIAENGLKWTPMFPKANESGLKMGLVKVPPGQEDLWITQMQQQKSFVRRAQRNPLHSETSVELAPPRRQVSLGGETSIKVVEKDITELDYRDYFVMVAFGVLFVLIVVSILLRVEKKYEPVELSEKKGGK